MLMIRPLRAFTIGRAMARVIQNGPDRFVAITASHSSALMRMSRLSRVIPALFTRMSMLPNSSRAAFTISSHASRPAPVSPCTTTARRPSPRISTRGRLGGVGVPAVVDRHVGTLSGEREGDRAAEAAAAAGDERHLPGQVEHHVAATSSRCGCPRRVCEPGARKARAGSAVHSTTAAPAV